MSSDTTQTSQTLNESDIEQLARLKTAHDAIRTELAKVIVGQDEVVGQLLKAVFSRGHCILEGVPGLAKTLLISSLSKCLDLNFRRVQFTPDLMPSDITGTEVLQEDKATQERHFKFLEGPIFTNLLLADEINRTPPKTQAALLEAMQEGQISIGGTTHALPKPFFVLATQNPIEQEGTYPLPEAQQDRFMFKVMVKYPSLAEEFQIAESTTSAGPAELSSILGAEAILEFQSLIRRMPVPPHVTMYALRLVRATRVLESEGIPDFVKEWLSWGAGPRAVQNLLLAGKAEAALSGRHFVTTGDIRSIAHPTLRHRILVNFAAESEGITTDTIVDKLLDHVSEAESDNVLPPELQKTFA